MQWLALEERQDAVVALLSKAARHGDPLKPKLVKWLDQTLRKIANEARESNHSNLVYRPNGAPFLNNWKFKTDEEMLPHLRRGIIAFSEWWETTSDDAAAVPAETNVPLSVDHADGPTMEGLFIVSGKPYRFASLQWRLLQIAVEQGKCVI